MNIEEKNVLIAEFMGWKNPSIEIPYAMGLTPNYINPLDYKEGNDGIKFIYPNEMKFHNSWDWLIPVVQKIYEKKWNEKDFINVYSGHIECIEEDLLNLSIEELYDDVVELISLYKNNE